MELPSGLLQKCSLSWFFFFGITCTEFPRVHFTCQRKSGAGVSAPGEQSSSFQITVYSTLHHRKWWRGLETNYEHRFKGSSRFGFGCMFVFNGLWFYPFLWLASIFIRDCLEPGLFLNGIDWNLQLHCFGSWKSLWSTGPSWTFKMPADLLSHSSHVQLGQWSWNT